MNNKRKMKKKKKKRNRLRQPKKREGVQNYLLA
jgi:hypothetical protein